MKLVGSLTSPYVRKVRVLLAEKQLAHEFLEESAWTAETTVPRYNPLNKVPALVLDDGHSIYDSAVISEYLDALPGRRFLPAGGAERASGPVGNGTRCTERPARQSTWRPTRPKGSRGPSKIEC